MYKTVGNKLLPHITSKKSSISNNNKLFIDKLKNSYIH